MIKKNVLIVLLILGVCASIAVIVMNSSTGVIELHLYYYKHEITNALGEMVAAFSTNNPGITIKTETIPNDSITNLRLRLFNGNAPDIMQLQSYGQVSEFGSAGYLLDLSNEPVISLVPDTFKSAVTYKEKVYALPMDLSGIGIIYNKNIFKKYGLNPPLTYSALKKVCNVFKDNGIVPFVGMLKVNWSAGHFMTLLHASLIKSNETMHDWITDMDMGKKSWSEPVNSNTLFEIMDFYRENLDRLAKEKKEEEQVDMFMKEEAAMMVQGLWVGIKLKNGPGPDWGFIPFPASDDPADTKFYADVDSTFAISVSVSGKKREAARKFLAWLATEEGIRLWTEKCRLISLFKDADLSPLPAPFRDFMAHYELHGAYDWEFCRYPVSVYEDAIKNGALDYISGQKSKEDVISYIDESWRVAIR